MKMIRKMIERVRVNLMPVRDFGGWMRKLEAMEAL